MGNDDETEFLTKTFDAAVKGVTKRLPTDKNQHAKPVHSPPTATAAI